MSLDPTVLTDLTGVTKRVYSQFFEDVFPYMTALLAQVKRMNPKRLRYGGENVFFSVRVDRRGGFHTSPGGFLPNGADAPTRMGSAGITRSYIKQELDGLALAATEANEASFVSLAKKSLDETFYEIQLNLNRILHGDSRGVRAVITTVTSATNITVNHMYGVTGAGHGAAHLSIGDQIAVRNSTGATFRGRATIASITPNADGTAAVVLNGAGIAGMAVNDVIVSASDQDDAYGAEANGLLAIIDPSNSFTTFEGINAAQAPRWKSQKRTATGGLVDEFEIMSLLYTIKSKGGIDPAMNPDEYLLITSTGILMSYAEPLLGQRRFERSYELRGGWKALEVAGLPLIDDPDCPRGNLYAVHVPSLAWVDLREFGKLKYGDSTAWIQSQGRDSFECTLRSYWNFICLVRNTHGVLTGITDNAEFSRVMY